MNQKVEKKVILKYFTHTKKVDIGLFIKARIRSVCGPRCPDSDPDLTKKVRIRLDTDLQHWLKCIFCQEALQACRNKVKVRKLGIKDVEQWIEAADVDKVNCFSI
jgi:hypothetical protein